MFDPVKAQRVIDGIADGELLSDICAEIGVNRVTLWRWQQADADFATQCARARESSASVNEEDVARLMVDVKAGDVAPDAARVILNGYTWLAKVRAPKKYGDRLELAGDKDNPLHVTVSPTDAGL